MPRRKIRLPIVIAVTAALTFAGIASGAKPKTGIYRDDRSAPIISLKVSAGGPGLSIKRFNHIDIFCGDALKGEAIRIKRSGKFKFEGIARGYDISLDGKFVSKTKAKGVVDFDPKPGSDVCSIQDEAFTVKRVG